MNRQQRRATPATNKRAAARGPAGLAPHEAPNEPSAELMRGSRLRWWRYFRDGHPLAFAFVLVAALAAGIASGVKYHDGDVISLSPPFARDGEFGWRAQLPEV